MIHQRFSKTFIILVQFLHCSTSAIGLNKNLYRRQKHYYSWDCGKNLQDHVHTKQPAVQNGHGFTNTVFLKDSASIIHIRLIQMKFFRLVGMKIFR
jgi:hypothetical protein